MNCGTIIAHSAIGVVAVLRIHVPYLLPTRVIPWAQFLSQS